MLYMWSHYYLEINTYLFPIEEMLVSKIVYMLKVKVSSSWNVCNCILPSSKHQYLSATINCSQNLEMALAESTSSWTVYRGWNDSPTYFTSEITVFYFKSIPWVSCSQNNFSYPLTLYPFYFPSASSSQFLFPFLPLCSGIISDSACMKHFWKCLWNHKYCQKLN